MGYSRKEDQDRPAVHAKMYSKLQKRVKGCTISVLADRFGSKATASTCRHPVSLIMTPISYIYHDFTCHDIAVGRKTTARCPPAAACDSRVCPLRSFALGS